MIHVDERRTIVSNVDQQVQIPEGCHNTNPQIIVDKAMSTDMEFEDLDP